MKESDKKIGILLELISNINLLNLTFIFGMALSFFKINKYIAFIIVMLFGVILANKTQKIMEKYLGDNKSISQSKFYIIFTILINILFFIYFFLQKEYVMLALMILFLVGYSLWTKIMYRKRNNN